MEAKVEGQKGINCEMIIPATHGRKVIYENGIIKVIKHNKIVCEDDIKSYYVAWAKESIFLGMKSIEIILAHDSYEGTIQITLTEQKAQDYLNALALKKQLEEYAILDMQKSAWASYSYKTPMQKEMERQEWKDAVDALLGKKPIEESYEDSCEYRLQQEQYKLQQKQYKHEKKAYRKMVKCPRCRSTSITYERKLSVGRGIAGGLIGGAAGGPLGEAVGITMGGLSGKKGYAVCLNCGKRWKV